MDGNKDESERCIRLAEKHISMKLFKKALRLAQKAHQLYPTDDTKKLIDKAKLLAERHESEEESSQANSQPANDKDAGSESSSAELPKSVDYIKNCKDYYEILGVSKNATELEIKKQYRKLALQFHPDKNKSPGAAEAFKAIGNAFAVLSDSEKRKRYDQMGNQDSFDEYRTRRHSNGFDYTRGFEEEFNPEEIFNMFFGGRGFPSRNVYVYSHRGPSYQRRTNNESPPQGGYTVLLQIMPILFFIFFSLMSNFVPDNPYSLSASSKYPHRRATKHLQVPYYVKDNFQFDYKGNLDQIEAHIEETYISNLQTACFKEKNYKENFIYKAKYTGDEKLLKKANSLKTPSCERLAEIEKQYYS